MCICAAVAIRRARGDDRGGGGGTVANRQPGRFMDGAGAQLPLGAPTGGRATGGFQDDFAFVRFWENIHFHSSWFL